MPRNTQIDTKTARVSGFIGWRARLSDGQQSIRSFGCEHVRDDALSWLRASLIRRTVFSCHEDASHPCGVGQTGLQEILRFTFHVVLNPANGDAVTVNQQIGSAPVSIVGLADAAAVGYGHVFQTAYVRTVDVSVDRDRSAKRSVHVLQLS